MPNLVMINGQTVAPEAAKISVFDRGFLYGDSVFETIRTYGGRLFEARAHVARLARSAERVFIDLPVTPEALVLEIEQAVRQAAFGESYIRVMVTRGIGEVGLAPEATQGPTRVIMVLPLAAPAPEDILNGIRVAVFRTARATDHTSAAGAKVANYLVSVLALREAKKVGASESLVVDAEESVLEGTTSNVFARIDGQWVTPPEEAGILAGLTRARLMDVARELGKPIQIRRLPLAELLTAEEVCISSSIREVVPVVSVDGRPIGNGRPGVASLALLRGFRASVERELGGF